MNTNWIVTANAGRARIFCQRKPSGPYEEIEDMVNEATRLRTVDTESDQLGQRAASKSINGSGAPTQPSGYEPNQLPAEHQAELFARSVNEYLVRAHQEQRFDQLTLAASPEFLGLLRRFVEPRLGPAIAQEINKDYTQLNGRDLQAKIESQTAH